MSRKSRQKHLVDAELAQSSVRRYRRTIAVAGALVIGICLIVGVFARLNSGLAVTPQPAAPALPDPTPQLAREYLYAGSRMLAVEDAGAQSLTATDLAVWRLSTGTWYVNGHSGLVSQGWGLSSDLPAPGDFDGDGKTDFCVFRPSAGTWYVLKSSDGNYYGTAFGASGDIPVPADFDGDGRADLALYRPSNQTWYWQQSSDNSSLYAQFGSSGDVPVPADYS